jgi:hypothetical protein
MKKNYSKRLESLKKRRLDDELQKALLTESFSDDRIGESVKYALESMSPIDPNYTKNTYFASEKIKNSLSHGLASKSISVEYRYQGSVETDTHIKLHSDIDILVFTELFYSLEQPLTVSFPYKGDPLVDLKKLREECFSILNSIYENVDNSKAKSIQVFPSNPKRKVDVVPANWLDTLDYQSTNDEKYRGIHIYDRTNHTRQKDFPFLHIANINSKNRLVNGGLSKLVRLLKTLKVDAENTINLSSFEITSVVFNMTIESLNKPKGHELLLLSEGSIQLFKLINDKTYRENILSPNGIERVFGVNDTKIIELKKLKVELDELIEDISEELGKQYKKLSDTFIYG